MAKKESRPDRWQRLTTEALTIRDEIVDKAQALADKLTELRDVQSEYEEWRDNLTENAQSGATAEKLEAVCDIDIESATDDPLSDWDGTVQAIEDAANAELPLGFGRD